MSCTTIIPLLNGKREKYCGSHCRLKEMRGGRFCLKSLDLHFSRHLGFAGSVGGC
jgi:hypothetical protein